ncbi:Uncharacterised protein [Vibrio cholerae]|nr:Uncharacterised protein [Vibrio cholerae]CSD88324.1 Uncharacterised protein [Vibrio cholerae]
MFQLFLQLGILNAAQFGFARREVSDNARGQLLFVEWFG